MCFACRKTRSLRSRRKSASPPSGRAFGGIWGRLGWGDGESLGENGLYLHSFPYTLAPKEQTNVPMLLWMSEAMRREDHVDYEKLRTAAPDLELSHDHLFHSVLGFVEIDTELYDPNLDLFKPFRTKKLPYR